jgi:hypothetical protein
MYPAFMLARNGGLRDTEIKTLTWSQVNFVAKTVKVGRAKSEAGEGRVVPLNSEVYQALIDHRAWYSKRFGETRDEWYVFPWGKPRPSDPARHITSFKTAWKTTDKVGRLYNLLRKELGFLPDETGNGFEEKMGIEDFRGLFSGEHVSREMFEECQLVNSIYDDIASRIVQREDEVKQQLKDTQAQWEREPARTTLRTCR